MPPWGYVEEATNVGGPLAVFEGAMTEPIDLYIRELERRLLNAMRDSDLGELDALLADDLVFTDHLGALWGKQDDLSARRSGAIRVRAVEASQERVQVHDGVAVVNVRLSISGTFGGRRRAGRFGSRASGCPCGMGGGRSWPRIRRCWRVATTPPEGAAGRPIREACSPAPPDDSSDRSA